MGRLDELIGIDKVCGATNGVAYLGDIGMTEKEFSDYMSADDKDVPAFLAQRASHAARYVTSDVLNHYRSVIRPRTFIDRATIGEPDDRQELITADAGTINGMVLEVDARKSNVKLSISKLSIWTDTSSAFVVTIRDLADGSTVTTASLTAPTANVVTYYDQSIEIPIRRRKAKFLITHSLPTYYRTNAGKGSCSTCRGSSYKHSILEAYGASIASAGPFIRTSVESENHTAGLGLTVTVECDHAAWLCEHKSMMTLPMLYKIAADSKAIGSRNMDRLNNRTIDRDRLIRESNDMNREYAKLMDEVWKNIPLPSDRECFVCNSQTKVIVGIP